MLRIYLTSSPDFRTVVSRFTYHCQRIYLLSSPDLPTLVSGFAYHCLRIYLHLSPDLPTVVLDLPIILFELFFKISSKIQHGDHFPFLFQKKFIW